MITVNGKEVTLIGPTQCCSYLEQNNYPDQTDRRWNEWWYLTPKIQLFWHHAQRRGQSGGYKFCGRRLRNRVSYTYKEGNLHRLWQATFTGHEASLGRKCSDRRAWRRWLYYYLLMRLHGSVSVIFTWLVWRDWHYQSEPPAIFHGAYRNLCKTDAWNPCFWRSIRIWISTRTV